MPQPLDPFPIYKDGQRRIVHGVDYAGWAAQGWSLEPEELSAKEAADPPPLSPPSSPAPFSPSDSAPVPPDPPVPIAPEDPTAPTTFAQRQSALETMLNEDQGWRNIQQLAKDLGITEKPAGGWADAIPLILEKEGFTQ